MPMCNLIEYSDNYTDTSGSLWQFKREEPPADNDDFAVNNNKLNFQLFKYKAALAVKTANHTDTTTTNDLKNFVRNIKLVVPLKYFSNFRRPLEMPPMNCKIHLDLNWIEDCILSSAGDSANFKITDAKLHFPIVTLST